MGDGLTQSVQYFCHIKSPCILHHLPTCSHVPAVGHELIRRRTVMALILRNMLRRMFFRGDFMKNVLRGCEVKCEMKWNSECNNNSENGQNDDSLDKESDDFNLIGTYLRERSLEVVL